MNDTLFSVHEAQCTVRKHIGGTGHCGQCTQHDTYWRVHIA